VRSPRDARALARALEQAQDADFGAWTADALVLYESRLRSSGAVHSAVARLPLRGGGA
jgi:2'-5' RNA ligase